MAFPERSVHVETAAPSLRPRESARIQTLGPRSIGLMICTEVETVDPSLASACTVMVPLVLAHVTCVCDAVEPDKTQPRLDPEIDQFEIDPFVAKMVSEVFTSITGFCGLSVSAFCNRLLFCE